MLAALVTAAVARLAATDATEVQPKGPEDCVCVLFQASTLANEVGTMAEYEICTRINNRMREVT